jgi:hypothetical protein
MAGKTVRIEVNGTGLDAVECEPVAAAVIAAGRWVFYRARSGAPRGPFCMIGMCQDCIAEVDGCANVRTCMVPVRAGLRVRINE